MSLAAALAAGGGSGGPRSGSTSVNDDPLRSRWTDHGDEAVGNDGDDDDEEEDQTAASEFYQPDDELVSDASCRHSDFTMITSNQRHLLASSPPPLYISPPQPQQQQQHQRRQILGTASSAYRVASQNSNSHPHPLHHPPRPLEVQQQQPPPPPGQRRAPDSPTCESSPLQPPRKQQQPQEEQQQPHHHHHQYFLSRHLHAPATACCSSEEDEAELQDSFLLPPLPPAPVPTFQAAPPPDSSTLDGVDLVSPLSSPQLFFGRKSSSSSSSSSAIFEESKDLLPGSPSRLLTTPRAKNSVPTPRKPPSSARLRHPSASSPAVRLEHSVHAQALLLGVAFCALWTPSNLMAPNLTQMASDFRLDPTQRDLYLGSYCALAVGVLSLPISAAIGLSVDWGYHSRPLLLVGTALGGAASAVGTALSQRYPQLFAARFAQGGFMAASVPVAFSFLSDMFETSERNAASSGLTAMMGLGILAGQVYAGITGEVEGWRHAFWVSGIVQALAALLCAVLLQEPARGAKEHALQALLASGSRYDRRLTFEGFVAALVENPSNSLLLWQGFFSSVPWGVIFCFLNDYLSQECGFSVPDATFLVLVFGVGCTLGGILGGYLGGLVGTRNPAHLPLFMAASTALGILPFYRLLNPPFADPRGASGVGWACACGLVASLPAVNVRPCLLNVNPPETRGAALTAANLLVQLGRGLGPSGVTLLMSAAQVSRRTAFNATLAVFWLVSAVQLIWLARTLPKDQESMERGLALYARQALADAQNHPPPPSTPAPEDVVVIEDRMTSFDGLAARQTLEYVSDGIRELGHELRLLRCSVCAPEDGSSSGSNASSPPSSSAGSPLASPHPVNEDDDDGSDPPAYRLTRAPPSVVAAVSKPAGTGWQATRPGILPLFRPRVGDEPTESTPLVV